MNSNSFPVLSNAMMHCGHCVLYGHDNILQNISFCVPQNKSVIHLWNDIFHCIQVLKHLKSV